MRSSVASTVRSVLAITLVLSVRSDFISSRPVSAFLTIHPASARARPESKTRPFVATDPLMSNFAAPVEEESIPGQPLQPPLSPLSMTLDDLAAHLGGRGRALAAWDCYRIGVDPILYFDSTAAVAEGEIDSAVSRVVGQAASALRLENLAGMATRTTRSDIECHIPVKRRSEGLGKGSIAKLQERGGIEETVGMLSHFSMSSDGTAKLLIQMHSDGLEVETVIIPWYDRKEPRSTLCVSSQVGCRQGCTFCATGKMGKLRSLSSDEILAQVWFARKVCRVLEIPAIDNVVFMGMGEPSDNADAVVVAAKAMADRQRYGMAQSRVTISTVAPDPQCFMTLAEAPAALAWSVHASRDELRKTLVPTTKYTMEELRKGFCDALLTRSKKLRTTMLEIALIDGVNDSLEDAAHLAEFSNRISADVPGAKVVVNLIPYNSIDHPTYRKPSAEGVKAFQDRLMEEGVKVYVRTTRGDESAAACGQLATTKRKATQKRP